MLHVLYATYPIAVLAEFSGRKPVTVDIMYGTQPRNRIPSNSDQCDQCIYYFGI